MPKTQRGFAYHNFKDRNGTECSIQKSSDAMQDCIWLGARDIGLKKFTPYVGWEDVDTSRVGEVSYIANNRMHLTQKQASKLITILQRFVDTGDI